MTRPISELENYEKTIDKVIVTYGDGSVKEFNANDWFIFEKGVRSIAKSVDVIKKEV